MRSLVLALVLVASSPSWAQSLSREASISYAKATREEIERETARLASLPGGWPRTRAASEGFLGVRYRRSPLGEGSGIDPDPRLRWDAVDCITLIETSLALGEARNLFEVQTILDDIRYAEGKAPAFENRLHLMEAQWIPDLIRKGYLEDATARHGGSAVVRMDVEYDRESWRKGTNLPGLPWSDELAGRHSIPMIPLDAAMALADSLPEGLIVNVVRAPVPGKVNLITHSGFVVVHEGKRYVRHAALGPKAVIDEPLDAFLRRHSKMRLRKVVGVNLLSVRGNAERVQRLLSSKTAAGE